MNKYPELLGKQIECYESEDTEWLDIARRIFPEILAYLPRFKTARKNILTVYEPICQRASEKLGISFDIVAVIYVGIGCGAGWATRYEGQPAVLLGLENIVKERWQTKNRIEGLIAHEIGHLAHIEWRNGWDTFENEEKNPLFLLYSEGFAQRCEQLITDRDKWHLTQDTDWLSWCEKSKGWLAKEFLARLDKSEPVKDFFGSWFDIQGKKYTGYFLGYSFIRELERKYDLREIALLDSDNVRGLTLGYLKSVSIL